MRASRFVGALLTVALVASVVASQSCTTTQTPRGSTARASAPPTGAHVAEVERLPAHTDGGPEFLLLQNAGYACLYVEQRENPACVIYVLAGSPSCLAYRREDHFETDARTASRVRSEDYVHSGYDRGHMAPSHAIFAFFGERAEHETYLMSNVVPQRHTLNAGPWERLETLETESWAPDSGKIRVYCGSAYGGAATTIGRGVAVPSATWKIEVRATSEGRLEALGFLMPQSAEAHDPPEKFLASIRAIEGATHLDFFTELPREEQDALETARGNQWPR